MNLKKENIAFLQYAKLNFSSLSGLTSTQNYLLLDSIQLKIWMLNMKLFYFFIEYVMLDKIQYFVLETDPKPTR